MKDDIIGIEVCLTTTGFAVITGTKNIPQEIEGLIQDIPVCSAFMKRYLSTVIPSFTTLLHESLIHTLKTVVIDSEVQTIFVGEDPGVEETALVLYQNDIESPYTKSFFERWDKIRSLLFEYTIIRTDITGKNIGILTCISGYWANDKFSYLNKIDTPKFTIREPF